MTPLLHVSKTKPGAVHDFELYKKGTLILKDSTAFADSGYQGLDKLHIRTEIPFKASKNKSLDKEDKAYNDDKFIDAIEKKGCQAVIPPRKNRKIPRNYDKNIYKERHLIEYFFAKVKYFRRIFSRFDKTAQAYLVFLNIVAVDIWLR